MRRVMFVLLAVMLMLTACSKEKDEPVEPGKITSVETKELSDGSFVPITGSLSISRLMR